MLIDAAIGLAVISLFIFPAETQLQWGKYWRVRPLIVTPIVAALGSLSFILTNIARNKNTWKKVLAYFFANIGFIIALWMGIVLGLDGTLWD